MREKNEEWENFILENLDKILEIAMENKTLKTLTKTSLKEVLTYWAKKRKSIGKPLLPRLRLIKLKEESEKYIEVYFYYFYSRILFNYLLFISIGIKNNTNIKK